jgi:hypothetical protein
MTDTNDLPEVPADKPPPGYTEFYGWYQGNFYGLKAKNSAELARLRAEGRWFDQYGREIPRWRSDGSDNKNGGKLCWEPHPDPTRDQYGGLQPNPSAGAQIVFWSITAAVLIGVCVLVIRQFV